MAKRQHYLALDGLRGVAAISVVLFHRRHEFPGGHFLDHAYLAVDFFFILSGFVIAYAYGDELTASANIPRFLAKRVFRLWPLLLVGVTLGVILGLIKCFKHHVPITDLLVVLPFAVLCIPTFVSNSSSSEAFPLDRPAWSLFYEMLANIFYALIARWLTTGRVVILCAVGFAMLAATTWTNGAVVTPTSGLHDVIFATPRVLFGFFAGVLIYRLRKSGWMNRLVLPSWLLAVVLIALLMPNTKLPFGPLYDLACIGLAFPLIVISGIGVRLEGWPARIAIMSGALSYPVYVLHYPLYGLIQAATARFAVRSGAPEVAYIVAATLFTLLFSYAALRLYDEPVRQFLSRSLKRPARQDRPL